MITINIPNSPPFSIKHLVLDYNGTLAIDSKIISESIPLLKQLREKGICIHILTADTYGNVKKAASHIVDRIHIIDKDNQDQAKLTYIQSLEQNQVMAIGNGKNDILMLEKAALGIGVIQKEGAYAGIAVAADVLCTSLCDALHLLLQPDRLRATLRC